VGLAPAGVSIRIRFAFRKGYNVDTVRARSTSPGTTEAPERMLTTQSPPRDLSIPTADGLTLKGWHWTRPGPGPRGVVVIAHGFGEHGGCYGHVAEALGPALDVDFVAPDQRGHGRSPGRRGVVRTYEDLVEDLQATLRWVAGERPGVPLFLLGHSNGGLVALRAAIAGGADLAGLILSNPSLKIATGVPGYKLAIGQLLLRLAPGVTLSGQIDADQMTRDPDMQRAHHTDALRHNRISAPLYFGMADGGAVVIDRAEAIRHPVLMLLGGSDPVIDPETTRRFFERLASPDKTLHLYPAMLHEPLNELGRQHVFADVESWLRARMGE
jgi:alpha-beta hydrolase superfamily lysophospholipase